MSAFLKKVIIDHLFLKCGSSFLSMQRSRVHHKVFQRLQPPISPGTHSPSLRRSGRSGVIRAASGFLCISLADVPGTHAATGRRSRAAQIPPWAAALRAVALPPRLGPLGPLGAARWLRGSAGPGRGKQNRLIPPPSGRRVAARPGRQFLAYPAHGPHRAPWGPVGTSGSAHPAACQCAPRLPQPP